MSSKSLAAVTGDRMLRYIFDEMTPQTRAKFVVHLKQNPIDALAVKGMEEMCRKKGFTHQQAKEWLKETGKKEYDSWKKLQAQLRKG